MLSCESARRIVTDEVETSAAQAEVPALDAHLATCPACRAWTAEQLEVRALLGARPLAEVPAGLLSGVRARLEDPPGWLDAANWQTWSYRLLPVAAALVALALWQPFAARQADGVDLQPALRSWATSDNVLPAWVERLLPERDVEFNQDELLVAVLTGRPSGPEEPYDER
jgi:predicted anti-sigma-YlaC factor YlaD